MIDLKPKEKYATEKKYPSLKNICIHIINIYIFIKIPYVRRFDTKRD